MTRDRSESASSYAKNSLKGFRKVRNLIKGGYENKEEVGVRLQMLEELARGTLSCNLPPRIKHWVKVEKSATLEQLVKTVEEEDAEEREERWEKPRRRTQWPVATEKSLVRGWHRVERTETIRHDEMYGVVRDEKREDNGRMHR